MITETLVKIFVKPERYSTVNELRSAYIRVSGIVGIVTNLFLAATKGVVGLLLNSIAIIGDAVNNLSDCASSIVSLVGMKLAAKPADKDHPFGHARIEYIASTIIAAAIFFIGFELGRSSLREILNPTELEFSFWLVIVMGLSIVLKFALYIFNKKLNQLEASPILEAVAADSLSDILSTAVILLALLVAVLTGWKIDGYIGMAVAIFVAYSGFDIMRDMLDHILSKAPSSAMSQSIIEFIEQFDGVRGVHDLIVHDYGPTRQFATAHVEVDAKVDLMVSHDMIDLIERKIHESMGIHLVIHMDPIIYDDPYVTQLYNLTKEIVAAEAGIIDFHDFRVVRGPTHSNLIFDVTLDQECGRSPNALRQFFEKQLRQASGELIYVILTVDRSYISSYSDMGTNAPGHYNPSEKN
ncbi:MAG TPA: cation transporter [Clostridiaceae bacterium]|nr:cation transporter [Clostridiaceae bacterium]